MNEILCVQSAEPRSAKEQLKIALGAVFATVLPARATQLRASPTIGSSRKIERVIMAFLRDEARRNQDARFFERLHRDFWKGEGGAVFSANCDHRFKDLFLDQQQEELAKLRAAWGDHKCERIIEVGCCSGLLLEHLTTTLPGVVSSIGVDLNPTQIENNQKSADFDSRITFACADGLDFVISHARPGTLFVTNGGVLEYFSREQLNKMFTRIRDVGGCMFFSVEPVAPDHDWATTRQSVPFGEELSFSHNYRDAYESNGFRILHQRYVEFESWRWMATIAVVD